MKVRMLTSIASEASSLNYGDLTSLRDDIAKAWIAAGMCERVPDEVASAHDVAVMTKAAEAATDAAEESARREREAVDRASALETELKTLRTANADGEEVAARITALTRRAEAAERNAAELTANAASLAGERAARLDAERRVGELVAERDSALARTADVDALEAEVKRLREKQADDASALLAAEDQARTDQSLISRLQSEADSRAQEVANLTAQIEANSSKLERKG